MDDVAGPKRHRAVPGVDQQRAVQRQVDCRAGDRAVRHVDPDLAPNGGRMLQVGATEEFAAVGGLQTGEAGLEPGQDGFQQFCTVDPVAGGRQRRGTGRGVVAESRPADVDPHADHDRHRSGARCSIWPTAGPTGRRPGSTRPIRNRPIRNRPTTSRSTTSRPSGDQFGEDAGDLAGGGSIHEQHVVGPLHGCQHAKGGEGVDGCHGEGGGDQRVAIRVPGGP